MNINERFKAIRNDKKLSQTDFGKVIGVSRDAIANIENGRIEPKEIHIISVCREFGVSEDWLRTGEGEMIIPRTRDEEIAAFIGSIQCEDSFKNRFIAMLAKLDESEWEVLEHMAELISSGKDKDQE